MSEEEEGVVFPTSTPGDVWEVMPKWMRIGSGVFLVSFCVLFISFVYIADQNDELRNQEIRSIGCRYNLEEYGPEFMGKMHAEIRERVLKNPIFDPEASSSLRRNFYRRMERNRRDEGPIDSGFPESMGRPFSLVEEGTFVDSVSPREERKVRQEGNEESPPISVGVLYVAGAPLRNRFYTGIEYPFIQESNFLYLSGIYQPDYQIMIDIKTRKTYLFAPRRDPYFSLWNAHVPSFEYLEKTYLVDEIHYTDEFEAVVTQIQGQDEGFKIYTLVDTALPLDENSTASFEVDEVMLKTLLRSERPRKTDREIELLRIAVKESDRKEQISSQGIFDVMKHSRSGLYEYSLSAYFDDYVSRCGFESLGYETIVGAGYNSAILHYTTRTSRIEKGDLLLIDGGGQFRGYTADVTRTFPIGKKFGDRQKMIYNIVYNVQSKCIDILGPNITFTEVKAKASFFLCEELIEHKFIIGRDTEQCVEERIYSPFMPHGLGHFIGGDVHDYTVVDTNLEPNMVLTIEPGVYFNEVVFEEKLKNPSVAPYLNMTLVNEFLERRIGGVRIEDDLLILPTGSELLSDIPRELTEVEKFINI